MKSRSHWRTFLILAVATLGLWRGGVWLFGDANGAQGLVNQIWIDHMPRDQRDLVGHLIVVEDKKDRGARFGVAGRASRWRILADHFIWGLDGDLLRTRFPQDNRRTSFRVRTWRCAGEAPKPFELCLELEHGGRKVKLYSKKNWVVRPGAAWPDEVAHLGPALAAARPSAEEALDDAGSTEAPEGWSPWNEPANFRP